jgi:curved DNA-binding protein CbpA
VIDEEALRLAVLSEHLDEVDYYALLELARDASVEAIRDRFHDFALRFHPDQHVGDGARQRMALKIFKRGAEAYRVLMHPVLRARYDEALASGSVRLSTEAMQLPAEEREGTEVPPAARAFYEQAVEALKRGEIGSARMHLALAQSRASGVALERLAQAIEQAARGR